MFLYNNDKKNMAVVYDYLTDIREDYRSQIILIDNDIARASEIIEKSKINMQQIKSTFDSSYLILSSSQVAMVNEYAEIDSLQEIINIREKEIDELNCRKSELTEKLLEIEDVIMCANSVRKAFDEKSFTWNIVKLFWFYVSRETL